MNTALTAARMSRLGLVTPTRSRLKRWACAFLNHKLGKLKFQTYSPSGVVKSDMRRCLCGRLWSKGGLSNVSNGDVIAPAR